MQAQKARSRRCSSSPQKWHAAVFLWKEAEDGKLYLTPTKTAQPSIYDPLSEYQRIVLDAINIGRLGTQHKSEKEMQKVIQQFEDIAFSYLTSVIFYEDYDMTQPEQRLLGVQT